MFIKLSLRRAYKVKGMIIEMDKIMQILNLNSPIIYILITWSIIWKGLALWHSARNKQLIWYIVLLIVNTVGILEIVYFIFFKKELKDSL